MLTNAQSTAGKIRFGIKSKLLTGFFLIIVFSAISIISTLYLLGPTKKFATQVVNGTMPAYSALVELEKSIYQTQSEIRGWLLYSKPLHRDNVLNGLREIIEERSAVDTAINADANQTNIDNWRIVKDMLLQRNEVYRQVLVQTNPAAAKELLETNGQILSYKILDVLDGLRNVKGVRDGGINDALAKSLDSGSLKILQDMDRLQTVESIFLGMSVIFSILIALLTSHLIIPALYRAIDVARRIAAGERNFAMHTGAHDETGVLLQSLNSMHDAIIDNEAKLTNAEQVTRQLFDNIVRTAARFSAHISKVAQGNLTELLAVENTEEMQQLGVDLNSMTQGLATITRQITEAAHNMANTLAEVKQAVDMQSTGATEQAASINEITASLSEIEQSSNQTMEKAKNLGVIAERTREKGETGLQAVEQSILGMKTVREKVQSIASNILELSRQTQQVGDITQVVSTLAQQSKMLALNASIEAAKAGEAGKGFAVVAAEVKNLAEQSEHSLTQVQKILQDIRHATDKAVMVTEEGTKQVDFGTNLVEQTGAIIRSLSDVIYETAVAAQQIEAAVRQEGIGIEQITAGMTEINQVTATFVHSVSQTTDAMQHLSLITTNLKDYIGIYKV